MLVTNFLWSVDIKEYIQYPAVNIIRLAPILITTIATIAVGELINESIAIKLFMIIQTFSLKVLISNIKRISPQKRQTKLHFSPEI